MKTYREILAEHDRRMKSYDRTERALVTVAASAFVALALCIGWLISIL